MFHLYYCFYKAFTASWKLQLFERCFYIQLQCSSYEFLLFLWSPLLFLLSNTAYTTILHLRPKNKSNSNLLLTGCWKPVKIDQVSLVSWLVRLSGFSKWFSLIKAGSCRNSWYYVPQILFGAHSRYVVHFVEKCLSLVFVCVKNQDMYVNCNYGAVIDLAAWFAKSAEKW